MAAEGIREAIQMIGFETSSGFVRANPASKEWLTLLIRRLDAVASVCRLAASMSPGVDWFWFRVEFHDDRGFGVVRQGAS